MQESMWQLMPRYTPCRPLPFIISTMKLSSREMDSFEARCQVHPTLLTLFASMTQSAMKDERSASLMGLHAAKLPSPNITYGLPFFTMSICRGEGTELAVVRQDKHIPQGKCGDQAWGQGTGMTACKRHLKRAAGGTHRRDGNCS